MYFFLMIFFRSKRMGFVGYRVTIVDVFCLGEIRYLFYVFIFVDVFFWIGYFFIRL